MPEYVYTLSALADKEGTTREYLNLMIHRLQKTDKPLVWKDYKLFKTSAGWMAANIDADVEVL